MVPITPELNHAVPTTADSVHDLDEIRRPTSDGADDLRKRHRFRKLLGKNAARKIRMAPVARATLSTYPTMLAKRNPSGSSVFVINAEPPIGIFENRKIRPVFRAEARCQIITPQHKRKNIIPTTAATLSSAVLISPN